MILVVLAAIGGALVTQRSDAGPQRPSAGTSARLGSTVVADRGGYVLGAQSAGERIWAMTCVSLCGAADTALDSERLVELDARSGAVLRRLPSLTDAPAFTVAGRSLWVAHISSGVVVRLDPLSGRVTATVRLRLPKPIARHDRKFLPDTLSYAGGYVWVSTARGWLAQIDARSGRLLRMLPTPSEDNNSATDRHSLWVAEDLDGVGRLAAGAKRLGIHTIMEAGLPLDVYNVLAGGRVVWALASPEAAGTSTATTVLAIDARTGRVLRRLTVPTDASGAAVAGGALYLANLSHGRVYRVSRDGSLQTFATARHDAWLATATPGALWAAVGARSRREALRMVRIRLPSA